MPDVLFIGAGPVGLFTAIQLKLLNPSANIHMLEKYQDYQRKHLLRLDRRSFAYSCPNKEFQAFLKSLPDTLRTNDLESALLEYAKHLGIEIEYQHVIDCEQLKKDYPDTHLFVGSDGSHSVVQKEIFNEEYQIKETLQYVVEIKYDVEGKTRYLNTFMEAMPATAYAEHFIAETVGKEKEGKTAVSVRIFVNKETYDFMHEATFKNPYHLSEPEKIHPEVLKSINAWLLARQTLAHEKRIEDSERITVTHLPVYASKEFVKEKHEALWFIVGDAAFGVPYFRSLNNGILCSSQLAQVLHAKLKGLRMELEASAPYSLPEVVSPEVFYTTYVQALVARENFKAEFKNIGVNSLAATTYCAQGKIGRTSAGNKLSFWGDGRRYKKQMQDNNEQAEKSWLCVLY